MKKYAASIKKVLNKAKALAQSENLLVAMFLGLYVGSASAFTLPWERTLCQFATSLSGATAFAIATIAFLAAAAAFVWGEEFAGMSKKLVNTTMAVTILIGAGALVSGIASSMGSGASSATCQQYSAMS